MKTKSPSIRYEGLSKLRESSARRVISLGEYSFMHQEKLTRVNGINNANAATAAATGSWLQMLV